MTQGIDDRTLLANVETLIQQFTASREPGVLHAAIRAFDALPDHLPQRPRLAAILVVEQLRASMMREPEQLRRAVELADIADRDRDPSPDWPPAGAVVRAMDLAYSAQLGRPGVGPRQALAEVDRLTMIVGDRQPYRTMIDMARLAIRGQIATIDLDSEGAAEVAAGVNRVKDAMPPQSPERIRMDVMSLFTEGHSQATRGDIEGASTTLERALALTADLPPTDPLRRQIENAIESFGPFLRMARPGGVADERLRGEGVGPLDLQMTGQVASLEAQADAPGLSDTERAMRVAALGAALLALGIDDRAGVERAIVRLEQAAELSPEHDPRRPFYLISAGTAHARLHELTGDRAALNRGTARLEQARDAAGTTAHAYWTMAAMPLAHAYRLSGRMELGRRTAMTALRGHAWSALLQSDPTQVSNAARQAAEDAIDIARWCLMDSDAAGAATALDAGRGLMLYAATETRSLADRLDQLGEQHLAQQWRQEVARVGPTEASPALRRRAIAAVAGIPVDADGLMTATPAGGSARLLDPPSLDEVRAALTTMEMDALVYLVPGDKGIGAAVVVPRNSEPIALHLPALNGTEEFDRLVVAMSEDAGRVRDLGTTAGDDPDLIGRARQRLDDVCGWAWRVAIGPLLERGIERPYGRPPRIVLVPMRELALVPWHAASRRVGGRTRYAVEDAVFSYATSARLLCDVAWAPTVSTADGGLFVGDPDAGRAVPDLPDARAEALAVRAAFYPGARYIGRRDDGATAADGAGNRRDLLAWLADPAGGGLLHLACHGVVRTGGSGGPHSGESHLVLAGGERLEAGELLRRAATGAGRPIGLAVLAACRSGVPARGYDDAYSLATTFLAGGIRSVVSAQWSVPDSPTSVLMFMFHHFLRRDGMRPVDALRAAQLWMLSDTAVPPETMPPRLRASHAGRAEVASWAGFVHAGR